MTSMPEIPKTSGPKRPYNLPKLSRLGSFRSQEFYSRATPSLLGNERFRAADGLANNIFRIQDELSDRASICGFHQFISNEMNLRSTGRKVSALDSIHLGLANAALENPKINNPARAAFVLRNYVDFYHRAASGEMTLLPNATNAPYVEAVGIDRSGCVVLFKDGYWTRLRDASPTDCVDFSKCGWEAGKPTFTPDMFYTLFISRLIYAHQEHNFDEKFINSIFITCTPYFLSRLHSGELSSDRKTWFSTSLKYASNFSNGARALGRRLKTERELRRFMEEHRLIAPDPGQKNQYVWNRSPFEMQLPEGPLKDAAKKLWMSDPMNYVLVQIKIGKENYLKLLEEFKERIKKERLEGIHAFNKKEPSLDHFVAKFDRTTPTFATSIASPLLKGFEAEIIDVPDKKAKRKG